MKELLFIVGGFAVVYLVVKSRATPTDDAGGVPSYGPGTGAGLGSNTPPLSYSPLGPSAAGANFDQYLPQSVIDAISNAERDWGMVPTAQPIIINGVPVE